MVPIQHTLSGSRISFIAQLRYPLAALVVLRHVNFTNCFTQLTDSAESAHLFIHMLTVGFASFAVPLFFAISGYLFFYGTKEFTFSIYRQKLGRRIRTLVIPYVAWCTIAFLLHAAVSVKNGEPLPWPLSLDLWWGCRQIIPGYVCLLGYSVAPVTAPVLVPLWFMRDIFMLALLAPFVRFVLRHMGWWCILLLATAYYTHVSPNLGGISLEGPLFFCTGALCSIRGIDPLAATRRWLPVVSVFATLWLLAYVVFWGRAHWAITDTLRALYHWNVMVVAIHVADAASRRCPLPEGFSKSSFFLYAFHLLILFVLLNPVMSLVQNKGAATIVCAYVGCFVLTLLLSMWAFRIVSWAEHGVGILTGIWSKRPR